MNLRTKELGPDTGYADDGAEQRQAGAAQPAKPPALPPVHLPANLRSCEPAGAAQAPLSVLSRPSLPLFHSSSGHVTHTQGRIKYVNSH